MKIAKPQVHLRKDNNTGTYYIHVITWMDYTRFKADGYESISTNAVNGVFTVTLKITEDTSLMDMELLTPIVHTLELTGIELNSTNPYLEVRVINSGDNSEMGKRRKTHQDDADDSGMPTPKTK
ncbi:MAG: hypothetical protein IT236_18895 [Bacteroidia bacterium]|nr:hypothetical protein [Bacteroidia bacterium]